ncbi:hybrid sensor histidine kinase/response regulator transcription factor [Flavilitoribacter nigricans]|uniref:hybrid sensor histidine kinase/response regulator transcription factor n=1 Tax=Flavilitoribacter nigricans TaxID=70997 RepID=UPI001C9E6DB5|nr:two-component regulator propeller domain-containing protein [Flavilitoribacter nigricans]
MKKVTIYIWAALIFWPVLSWGQKYYFRHFKVEDGLSHNTVMSSLQDSKGFMWFGTKNGLNRFDGYTFKLFQKDPSDPRSLLGSYVQCLHEYGPMWVGTDNGLFKYDEELENFELLRPTEGLALADIENDGEGNLWFIAANQLHRYHTESGAIHKFPTPNNMEYVDITLLQDGRLLITSSDALYLYQKADDSFQELDLEVKSSAERPFRINRSFSLDPTTILLGTRNHGVIAYDLENARTWDFLPTQDPVYVRDITRRGDELWIASESGLHIYNLQDQSYTNPRKNYNDPYALSDNAIYTLALDQEGGVWAGSYFGGVNYYPKPYTPFRKFFPNVSENSISGNAVREIHSDQYGSIWIGTEDGGLNKYDPDREVFTHYTSVDRGGTLSHFNIHAVLPVGDKLWVGMFEHGLDILDIPTGRVVGHYNVDDESELLSNFVYHLYQTRSGEMYVVTTRGIQTYDPVQDKFLLVDAFPQNMAYTCLIEDDAGKIWAGSYWDGLYYYDPKTGEKGSFLQDGEDGECISHNQINGIFEDSSKNLWVSTEHGLNLYDKAKGTFRKFTMEDGFPSNVFYAFIEDDEHQLWISTANGLVVYDPESGDKKIYTQANGLLTNQFNYCSAHKDRTGRMYFGSVNGLISFDPRDFVVNSYKPPIYITGIQINNRPVPINSGGSPLAKSVTFTEKIELKPRESSFSLDFSALSYTTPEMTEYWYQLGGLNEEWVPLEKNHKVFFTELPAGDYNFKVKSVNNSGIWSEEASALQIKVLPTFWKSNLAYGLYIGLIGFLFYLGLRFYHQRIKSRNKELLRELGIKKEKEVFQAKIEFFTNVSHEIRTPLTLIKSPLEKMLKKADLKSELGENLSIMDKNTSRLLDLVNQLLDFRKTELEDINLSFVKLNISDLVRNTSTRFSPSVKDKKLDLEISQPEKDIYAFVDAEAIKKILSNLISNAIKYAENSVGISLEKNEDFFELQVRNDGPLIPAHLAGKIFEPFYRVPGSENQKQTGTGIGLSLAHSLTELHHGSLRLDTSSSHLNTFVLRLPLRQEREFPLYLSKEAETEKVVERQALELAESANQPAILLVEDNEDLLDFIAKDLVEDYQVFKATSAEAAREFLQQEKIQLVVSDIMMSGMDGFALCKHIKTSLESSHIPVILLTAKSALQSKIEGLASGADAYIEKPFSMEHLKAQIANLLANRRYILEHFSSSPLAHIRSIAHTEVDENFIRKLDETMSEHISDPELNVETLAEIMHMSRSTLYRKIKEMSDLSPNELINIARLKKAAELLKKGDYKIYEIAEMVGYNSQTSFGRNFQKQFNMTPSEYVKS